MAALILVRHCHGYLFRDQSAGLLGILRICGSTLARVMPDPQVACDIVHPFCWLCRRPLSAMMSPPFERASSARHEVPAINSNGTKGTHQRTLVYTCDGGDA